MIKEKLLETVKNWEVGGAEFAEFIQYYIKSEEYLHKQCEDENCTDKNRSVIVKLEFWLEDEGLSYFMRTMEQIPADMADKVKSFAKLYQFLLENSENNVEKLVDHMFYIPGRFASDFATAQTEMFGKIEGAAGDFTRTGMEEYSFIGNLEKGSLFFACLAS